MPKRKIVSAAMSVVLGAGGSAAAATTMWTSPSGGAWTDPANWSNGVPTAADTAVLPGLDADGYAIVMPTSAGVAGLEVGAPVGGGEVILSGGSLLVGQVVAIGADGTIGALRVEGGMVQAGSLLVGNGGGTGILRVRGGGIVAANAVTSGDGGNGTLDVASGTKLLASGTILGPDSTLRLEAVPGADPVMLVDTLARGGTLEVVAGPGLALPSSLIVLLKSWSPLSGSFVQAVGPSIEGKEAPISETLLWIQVDAFDPVVTVDILLEHDPVYAGFSYILTAQVTRSSGATAIECDPVPCNVVWSVEGGDAELTVWGQTRMLFVPTISPCLVTGTYVAATYEQSGSLPVHPVIAPAFGYEKVALAADGSPADLNLPLEDSRAEWTPDGRFVAFPSKATNLVSPPVVSSAQHLYVKDRSTGAVDQVSVDGAWGVSDLDFFAPGISEDGRFVVFGRKLSGGAYQVWLRDRWLAITRLVSHSPTGEPANGNCGPMRISGDGTTITFESNATNLVDGTPPVVTQVFGYDVQADSMWVVSSPAPGVYANDHCQQPCVSSDGSRVAFRTRATNLVDDNSGSWRVVTVSRQTGEFVRVDVSTGGSGSDGSSASPEISGDGRYVAFKSTATNLGGIPDDNSADVFVRDIEGGATDCVSDAPPDGYPSTPNGAIAISASGAVVAYSTSPGAGNGSGLFVRRVVVATLASDWAVTNPWGGPGLVQAGALALSPDGNATLFAASPWGYFPGGIAAERMPIIQTFPAPLPADLNNDGYVNGADLAALLGAWGTSGPGDLDGDGAVGASDMAILIGAWTG